MKAVVCPGKNEGVSLTDVPKPGMAVGEVLVKVDAAAMNRRDLFITQGLYPGWKTGLPATLGADVCGTVEEVSEGGDQELVGQVVVVDPTMHWGDDERFPSADFNILGMPRDGTFAEYVSVPSTNVHNCPAHLQSNRTKAAALPLAGVTAWRALMTKGECKAGQKVLITGVGSGVQMFALQFALAAGADVVVTSSSQAKIDAAVAMGATGGVNYREESWAKAAKKMCGGGFDLVIDSAGGDGFGDVLHALANGGRVVFYGGTAGSWPKINPALLFFKQARVEGSTMGSPSDFRAMLDFVEEHQIVPVVSDTFSLEQCKEAFEFLEAGNQTGNVVFDVTKK